ncbi:sugar phosphate isomerase/epimerase family protein [Tuwongella immobilis]|uniref:Xylose isomerase-like TIM barrel domain-containing protein n=1 Tax=Tuwongella immobilis TaxID=692036 RepID=A0A6C2YS34_9BACT|nr:sugar phosphate isomerase/epimerase family protein [Tuwongella immobilis]VIP04171.1 xylose isomerase : Xylose isomerase domain protein TIM barrel OS=Planctomyces limnophilus (strain ATCC 43296 / DSM 3776 / IFAM 1008 / 290) GN=Plim_2642 PE=1 SV=1: AP_endonuc_2 [Tuwongella immobilis]VTS05707.1 xylose isomerase : Xylose isomerase domain protein TIM barrel OS=Planctomyces limnophilus (strain ATCC 43296 / DSM 3776 / IFAM 1008 / 290) GN=Plim_2642 PE=1 SV=1: AP_endonuc_2 [Tuwongella immobilis]
MTPMQTRRDFLATASGLTAGLLLPFSLRADSKAPLYQISLAQWSLHKAFFAKKLDPINFAVIAKKEFGIEAVEYVNQFYKDKVSDNSYLSELKKKADGEGVKGLLIMCDGEGALGDANEKARAKAVSNHQKWLEWAKFLGCHSIRVNAQSSGTYEEQLDRAADGLGKLTENAAKLGLNVIVENHGGLSSNGAWLAAVMKKVNLPGCGTLPDFGNFNLGNGKQYDRYKGIEELMPFAKGVSAKSHDFDDKGNEIHTDYRRMMKIVLAAGYHGFVGIEYEGSKLGEPEGILATKKLLEAVRTEMTKG